MAALSGAGFGVHWSTLLASTIGLNASNFLVGASIGLRPMDLQVMLIVANLVGIPLGIFRAWYYDNHNLKGGKFLPFIRRTALPIVLISLVFVWLPYENMGYITKAVTVWLMYFLLNIFLSFYTESYNYFQQIITPDAQERANVMSISQAIYSLAPTLSNLFIPLIAGWTWGLNNIWTYRIVYPIFTVIGFVICIIFFRRVKERLILPKKKPEPVKMFDAIKNARVKKEAASVIRKYGAENITAPDNSVKEEIQNRETSGFFESIKVRRELKAYLKTVSVYERAAKPYTNAKNLIEQAEYYTHYDELEEKFRQLRV